MPGSPSCASGRPAGGTVPHSRQARSPSRRLPNEAWPMLLRPRFNSPRLERLFAPRANLPSPLNHLKIQVVRGSPAAARLCSGQQKDVRMWLREVQVPPWPPADYSLEYKEDRTQWVKGAPSISVGCTLTVSRSDDPALIAFIEKIAKREISGATIELALGLTMTPDNSVTTTLSIDANATDEPTAKEVLKKLKSSNVLFLHNSVEGNQDMWYQGGKLRAFYDVVLSTKDKAAVSEAEKFVQRKVRKLAREHRDALNAMFGKMPEKYDVEFAALEGYSTRRMPLGTNLRDKSVEVPLNDWGSGTQNRTFVLMSILSANRIRTHQSTEDKITPIVVIEEPESFLHPSAQAEFGKLLQALSPELSVQIIASTHSPYMLNQAEPGANILLRRKLSYGNLKATERVRTDGDQWMAPFGEHLGVVDPEFESWRVLFSTRQSKVLMVEGDVDKEYFEYLRELLGDKFGLPADVEVVPYGGKDALRNTVLVKFMISRIEQVFITCDLDAIEDVKPALGRLGLKEGVDFCAVGDAKPGRGAIEGLLPEKTVSAVYGRETDLVMQAAHSQNSGERRKAKEMLKRKYLEEFKSVSGYSDSELSALLKLGRVIRKKFAGATQ
jgi:putative ATP-dependent endonuclease of the OLD family